MAERVPPRTWIGGVGAVATATALVAVAGIPGAIAGAAVVLAWALIADVVALAVATVAVAALLSADAFVVLGPDVADGIPAVERLATLTGLGVVELLSLAAVAAALVPLLVGSTASGDRPVGVALLTLVISVALAGLALTPLLAGETVLAGAVTLATAIAVVAYGLHRYGLLVTGVLQHG